MTEDIHDQKGGSVKKGNPLVSICIPTFNSARFIRASLDSIVAQTYRPFEVIISDNASTDSTVDIVREYVNRYGFKLYQSTHNLGMGANFNKLISLARGKYVAIYHSDDVYERTIVEESVKVLEGDETIGLAGTMGNIINEGGISLSSMGLPKHLKKMNKTIYTFDEALSGIIKRGWFFVTPTIVVRKKVYDKLGVFDLKSYASALDYAMWLRIATQYKVAILDKKLINYRVHKNQVTEQEVRENPEVADIVLVLKEYKELTTNKKLQNECDDCINGDIISAAKKQNYYGLYSKSNETLRTLRSKNVVFLISQCVIRLCNFLKISIKKRTLSA